MFPRWVALLALMMFIIPTQADVPAYETTACPFYVPYTDEIEGETFECGWLTVPEMRDETSDSSIQLFVMILFATRSDSLGTVIYLEGGPGYAASSMYDVWLRSQMRGDYDLVLLDQRGTGYSVPSLDCPELDDAEEEDVEENEFALTQACYDELVASGVNPAAYTSAASAQDVGDLLVALELEEVNLYGISYGTRLALTIMRDRPEHIRSVILDSVYPPEVLGYEEQAVNSLRAFEVLFAGCAADDSCNTAFPNLEATFLETVDRLNEEPLILLDEEQNEIGELTGDDLVEQIFELLYDTSQIPLLPAMIVAAAEGDGFAYQFLADGGTTDSAEITDDELDLTALSDDEYMAEWATYLGYSDVEELDEYLSSLTSEEYNEAQSTFEAEVGGTNGILIDDFAEGMTNSVECYEEVPFNTVAGVESFSVNIPEVLYEGLVTTAIEEMEICEVWYVPPAPIMESEAVVSDLPTLVLSGEYDPITPPNWGQSATDALTNAQHYIMPGMGHGLVEIHPCPTQIALDFLADPEAELDTSCVAAMLPPDFVTDWDESSE